MNFLLIPGGGGEAWVWHRVEATLTTMGHNSVDLPADNENAGVPEYCEVALAALGDRTMPHVVGLSLGAFTAALVCLEIPTASLIFVNGMIPKKGETPGQWWEATDHAPAKAANDLRHGRNPKAAFDPMATFFHDVPPEVIVQAEHHNRMQSNGPFTSPWVLTGWPDIPTHVVIGRDDRFFPAEFQRHITRERLGLEPEVIGGGHLLPLSQPFEVATLLDAWARQHAIS
jgi:pimeloyl-ACP methyl ester carboxylesterase